MHDSLALLRSFFWAPSSWQETWQRAMTISLRAIERLQFSKIGVLFIVSRELVGDSHIGTAISPGSRCACSAWNLGNCRNRKCWIIPNESLEAQKQAAASPFLSPALPSLYTPNLLGIQRLAAWLGRQRRSRAIYPSTNKALNKLAWSVSFVPLASLHLPLSRILARLLNYSWHAMIIYKNHKQNEKKGRRVASNV
jgi:hypothetical protein